MVVVSVKIRNLIKKGIYIIKPIGYKAKQKNEDFISAYSQVINNLTFEFSKEFCDNGIINWEKLVKFNSGK